MDPGGEEYHVGVSRVEEMAVVEEGVEEVDCAGAVGDEGHVRDGEVGEESWDDVWVCGISIVE